MLKDKIIVQKAPFIAVVLRGVGQIMLQENAYTGLLLMLGIFLGSPVMSIAVLLATISGTLTAIILKYDKQEINRGLYGFSAALVGAALILFYKPVFIVWLFIVAGSVLAAKIQHFFIIYKIPVFTLPFVLVTWIALFLLDKIFFAEPSSLLSVESTIINHYFFPLHGFGQVIFQIKLIAGIIFLFAVFIHSPLAALFGFAGATVAGFFSVIFPVSVDIVELGLFSYNAVLCAIVFSGKKPFNIVWMLFSSLLSAVIYFLMYQLKFVPLTFPFVAATMITLLIKNLPEFRLKRNLKA